MDIGKGDDNGRQASVQGRGFNEKFLVSLTGPATFRKQGEPRAHLLDLLVLLDHIDRVPPSERLDIRKLVDSVVEDLREDRDFARSGRGDEFAWGDERAARAGLARLCGRADLGCRAWRVQ